MNSPFQPLTPGQQVADTITECTQIIIDLEQLASDPTNTTTLTNLFQNAANEYSYGQNIGSLGLTTVTQAVAAVTSTANSKKSTWEAEALSAEALSIAASAAQVAAAVFSWAPGINLCVDAGAIAACIAAQVLQAESASAENDVISYISNFNNEVLTQPGMSDLQSWNIAVQNNILNFKNLSLGATDQEIQATLMALTNYLIGQNEELTVGNYANVIFQIATTMENNPGIDQAWSNAMTALSNNPTPSEINQQAQAISTQFPQGWNASVIAMEVYTSIMTIVDSKAWMAVRKAFKFNFVDTGDTVSSQTLADNDPEVVRLGRWASRLKAFGTVVNVATTVFSIIGIIDTTNTASQMTDAINEANSGVSQYLTALVNAESAQQGSENS
jgi:hypothetical protein